MRAFIYIFILLLFISGNIKGVGFTVHQKGSQQEIDCDRFYRENFDSIAVQGVIYKKEVKDDLLLLYVKDVNKGIIPIKLLKNSSGFQIYNFAAWGSDVLKYAGKRNIHIRVKFPNGSMQGKVFFDFC